MSTRMIERPVRRPLDGAETAAKTGSGWYEALARVGLVAKGASFAIVGVLALKLALGDGGKATSRQGALQSLAGTSFGKIFLVLLALGFAAYAIWRFVQAVAERTRDEDSAAKAWAKRAGYIGRGIIYASLTFSTIKILVDAGQQQSQNGKAKQTTATILSLPGGTWIVGIAGAIIVGVGLWNLYRGIARTFEEKWHGHHKWGSRAGVVGHCARFVVFGLIGVFAVKAAIDYNPKDAIGLDGALQKLAHTSYGPFLLGLTAIGLVAYAVFCLFDARYRDVTR